VTGARALMGAVADLRAAGVPEPAGDARALLAAAMGLARDRLTLHLKEDLDDEAEMAFFQMVAERGARRPMSHILRGRLFFGRWFEVTPDVLDPRPETETLIVRALERPFRQVLDLGTGSGAIVLSLLAERGDSTAVGTDLSPAALQVAQRNATALGVDDRVWLTRSDWFAGIAGGFDLIVSNPPYIAARDMAGLDPEVRDFEPAMALTDGGDGLASFRAIAAGACSHLTPGGRLLVEIGPSQAGDVHGIFAAAGLEDIATYPDMDGRDRVVSALNPG